MQPAQLRSHLADLVGADHAHDGGTRDAIDEVVPAAVVDPSSTQEVQEIVRFAAVEALGIVPRGGGTKLSIGNPPAKFDVVLSSHRLNRIIDYDYDNLTVSLGAGVPLASLQTVLAERHQFLPHDGPFAPMATAGGIAATNSSGPSRPLYGAPRDLVVGGECVLGTGDAIRAGGKVVKNVSGYDLNKLLVQSYGTIAFISELTFRVYPVPERRSAIVLSFDDVEHAGAFAARILKSFLVPCAIVLLDSTTARAFTGMSTTTALLISVEGIPVAVERQVSQVREWHSGHPAASVNVDGPEWQALCNFPFNGISSTDDVSWRISTDISKTPSLLAASGRISREFHVQCEAVAHYACGWVLGRFRSEDEQHIVSAIAALRLQAQQHGGHLTVLQAPLNVKRQIDVWGEQPGSISLMRRIKESFDPHAIFSPGRFVGGI